MSKTIDNIIPVTIPTNLSTSTLIATATTASKSKTSGAITSAGGLGVAGKITSNDLKVDSSSAKSAGTDIVLSPYTGSNAVVIKNSDGSVNMNAALFGNATGSGNTLNVDGSIGTNASCNFGGIYFADASQAIGQAALTYYANNWQTVSLSGPWASAQTATFQIIRVGELVNLFSADVEISAAATSSNIITGSLPNVDVIPLVDFSTPIVVKNNSAYTFGRLELTQAGAINIYADAGSTAFTNAGNCGYKGFSVTYDVS